MNVVKIDNAQVQVVPALAALAAEICSGLSAMRGHVRNALRTALDVGEKLLLVQARLPERQLSCWLENNCDLKKRQAELYMQLARSRDEIEARIAEVAHLSLRAARQLIAQPKSPPPGTPMRGSTSTPTHRGPKTNLLEIWESAEPFAQRAILASMPREQLIAVLPEDLQAALKKPSQVKPFPTAKPIPEGDDGLDIPDFLNRKCPSPHTDPGGARC
jgi:hypothetical protein